MSPINGSFNWNNDCNINFLFWKINIKMMKLDINNFFSFLAAMMLAYQPVRSLINTLNIVIKSRFICCIKNFTNY